MLTDFIKSLTPIKFNEIKNEPLVKVESTVACHGPMMLSRYVSWNDKPKLISNVDSFTLEAGPALLDAFHKMIHISYDTVYLNIITRKDDTLITLKHNKILGSHRLCVVPTAEVLALRKRKKYTRQA